MPRELDGYILGVNHLVHLEFTYQKFKEYADYLRNSYPTERFKIEVEDSPT